MQPGPAILEAAPTAPFIVQPTDAAAGPPTLPIWAAALVVAVMMPEDLNIRPFGMLITAPRLILLAAVPLTLLAGKARSPRRGAGCFATDLFVALTGFWMLCSVAMTEGVERAVIGSGVMVLEFCGAYTLMRRMVSAPEQVVLVVRLMAVAIAVTVSLAVLDVVTDRPLFHELTNAISGYDKPWRSDYRNGIRRAQGVFEHPIMQGTIACMGLILATLVLGGAARIIAIGGCSVGLICSMSSAPLGAALIACATVGWWHLTFGFDGRWRLLRGVAIGLFAILMLVHPRPFSFLIDLTTMDPHTGYYRLLIWNVVGDIVLENPIFGLGFFGYSPVEHGLAPTVDAIWLNAALTFGIPGSVFAGAALLSACRGRVDTVLAVSLSDEQKRVGLALSVVIGLYVLLGFTVHFWGANWILMGMFAGLRANLGAQSMAYRNVPV